MNKPILLPIAILRTGDDWIKHIVDKHTQMPGTPSPDDMRKYPRVLLQMMKDHHDLHVHFYTGHEHKAGLFGNVVVPGRTK